MDTPTMSQCAAFLNAVNVLPPDEWRRRAAAAHQRPAQTRAAVRAELERRCDAFELWSLRDEVAALCWRLNPTERAWLREAIADAALAVLAGACEQQEVAAEMLVAFTDLVPGQRSLAPSVHER